ncbi:MAG: SurA N-terminal domain-containing protein [Vicinamibacterales bacterium]
MLCFTSPIAFGGRSHAGLALAVLVLVSGCNSTPAPTPTPTVSPDTWAVVDGRDIKQDDVEKAFRRARDITQPMSDEEAFTAKLTLLNELIVQDLLLAKARELKVELPATELDAAFAEAKKNIPDQAFQDELKQRNLTPDDMREGLRRQLLSEKMVEREVRAKINVTDQEVADFFTANRTQFNLPEDAYRVAQIVITPVREPQLANRTGDDASTPQAAAAKAAMIMEKLKGGATFGDLAMDYSEDPETAPRGGDLGFMTRSQLNQVPPALRDAVLQIPVGSARIVAREGAHTVIHVVAKETAGQRELATPGVREQITETLRGRREALLRTAYLTELRGNARVVNYLARQIVEKQGKM